jgi:cytochrome c553
VRYSVATLVVTVLLVGSDPNLSRAQESTRTKLIYMTLCASCHGLKGKGDGAEVATLNKRPRSFDDCPAMNNFSDEVLFRAIKYGGATVGISDEMPGWAAGIADRDIRELVQYVRVFCRGALAHNLSDSIPAKLQLSLGCGRPHEDPCVGAATVRVTSQAFAEFRD